MATCPFCHGIFTEAGLIEHIARVEHREGYAKLMAVSLRLQHQEGQLALSDSLRRIRYVSL